jgi:hypothetical protein
MYGRQKTQGFLCSETSSAGLFLQLDLLFERPAQHKLKQAGVFCPLGVSGKEVWSQSGYFLKRETGDQLYGIFGVSSKL